MTMNRTQSRKKLAEFHEIVGPAFTAWQEADEEHKVACANEVRHKLAETMNQVNPGFYPDPAADDGEPLPIHLQGLIKSILATPVDD